MRLQFLVVCVVVVCCVRSFVLGSRLCLCVVCCGLCGHPTPQRPFFVVLPRTRTTATNKRERHRKIGERGHDVGLETQGQEP